MRSLEHPLEGPVGLRGLVDEAGANLRWLHENVAGIFSGTMREDGDAIVALSTGLGRVGRDRQLVIADRERELIVARLDIPGSIAATVQQLRDREISCAEMFHSWGPVPGTERALEIQRYAFDRKADAEIAQAARPVIPRPAPGSSFTPKSRPGRTSGGRRGCSSRWGTRRSATSSPR
jgi:hypothetical protein